MMGTRKRNGTQRRGAAAVETAIVAPIFVLGLFAFLEFGQVLQAGQAVHLAVNRGIRTASLPGATMSDVQEMVDQAMSKSGLEGYLVTSNVSDTDDVEVWVEVSVPLDKVSYVGNWMGLGSRKFSARAASGRENNRGGMGAAIDPDAY